jgi:hypothetical protein
LPTGCIVVLVAAWASATHAQPTGRLAHEQPERSFNLSETVAEASARFGVPVRWIAAVMQVESRGDPRALSPKGAIGLMQIMPATYASLAARYGLGANPWNVRDNIMAGAAYLRELYDRYGASGFLAAYNAGPGRWEDHLSGVRPLPGETVRYLSRLGPSIGADIAPGSNVSSQAAALPPSTAPIFVALKVVEPAVQRAAERERVLRIIAENETVLDAGDRLFVARANATKAAEHRSERDARNDVRSALSSQPPPQSPTSAAVANSLFAAHDQH